MKRAFFLFLASTVFALPSFADEAEPTHDNGQPVHYAVEKPVSKEAAVALLKSTLTKMEALVAKPKMEDSDLESVHEATYSLEASVDSLREFQTAENESKLDALDETVQAIHHASEARAEATVREWEPKLVAATESVEHAF